MMTMLNTKSFHKRVGRYVQKQSGARNVIMINEGSYYIVDMGYEMKRQMPILLLSRPVALEAVFTHLQRLILYLDAKLQSDDFFFLSVFGSDNLSDWKCIISAQKMNTALRQIRTNKAPKSYRDYVILITGMVNTDTDLSDIIADYTVVTRRLG